MRNFEIVLKLFSEVAIPFYIPASCNVWRFQFLYIFVIYNVCYWLYQTSNQVKIAFDYSHSSRRDCCCLVAKLCLTLCGPMDYSPSRSSVHGSFQARILEWFGLSFSSDQSNPSLLPGRPILYHRTTWEAFIRCEVVSYFGFDLHFPNSLWCWGLLCVLIGCLHIFFG